MKEPIVSLNAFLRIIENGSEKSKENGGHNGIRTRVDTSKGYHDCPLHYVTSYVT